MPTSYSDVLVGDGDTDYARYMQTDALLALQRQPGERIHRDELLFQVVHQCTELLLKLACSDIREVIRLLEDGRLDGAVRLLNRTADYGRELSGLLDLLRHLNPCDFQVIRTVLGNGSGIQSPGWREVRTASADLRKAFARHVADDEVAELYSSGQDNPLHRLAEAMLEWDERVNIWRVRHFKLAVRILGSDSVGTRGMPIDGLRKLTEHQLFPALWAARSTIAGRAEEASEAITLGPAVCAES